MKLKKVKTTSPCHIDNKYFDLNPMVLDHSNSRVCVSSIILPSLSHLKIQKSSLLRIMLLFSDSGS